MDISGREYQMVISPNYTAVCTVRYTGHVSQENLQLYDTEQSSFIDNVSVLSKSIFTAVATC